MQVWSNLGREPGSKTLKDGEKKHKTDRWIPCWTGLTELLASQAFLNPTLIALTDPKPASNSESSEDMTQRLFGIFKDGTADMA